MMPKTETSAVAEPTTKRLLENVEKLMAERGIPSRDKLAKAAHLSKVTLYRIWKGKQRPRDETIRRIADVFKVSPTELWGRTARPPTAESGEEEIHPGKQSFSRRMQIRNSTINALAMTAIRYNVSPGQIVEAAPLLFCLVAEESLKQRMARLVEVHEAIDRVSAAQTNFPHIPGSEFDHWSEGLEAEAASIASRDLFAKKVDQAPIHSSTDDRYDSGTDNPLVTYLRERAMALSGIEVSSWASWHGPEYRVTREQALDYVGGNEEGAEAIMSGAAPVNVMDREIGNKAAPEARADWAIARAREHQARVDAFEDQLLRRAAEAIADDLPDDLVLKSGDEE